MADTVTVKVEGLSTVQSAIEGLPRHVQYRVLADALEAGGTVLDEGISEKIHSRSGATVRDIHVEVQLEPEKFAGVARIGASREKNGRAFILNFLERGTKPHVEPRKAPTAPGSPRRSVSRGQLITRLQRQARAGPRKVVAFGGKVYSRVKHPGFHAQAPMRETIATHGAASVKAFADTAWQGITEYCEAQSK